MLEEALQWNSWMGQVIKFSWLKPQLQPIGGGNYLTAEENEDDKEDKPAAAAAAGKSFSKPKPALQPIEQHVKHQ